ncbi:MAG: SprT-like domain-containing protein [Flavobacteriaceae bacterium]
MEDGLNRYLPAAAIHSAKRLLDTLDVHIKIVNIRVSRHGDYKRLADGSHAITLNATPNPYRFLITMLHEIAHLQAFENFGRRIKPHGKEWKRTFQHLMLPFLRPEIFPSELLSVLAYHIKNPKASSSTDANLAFALKKYDPPTNTVSVLEIPSGGIFSMYNGKKFQRGKKRVKRIECIELSSGRLYLFQPNAEVVLISK